GGARADIGPKRPGPSKETMIVGLCQVRRLHCCAPRQGTYLGFVATPHIHPHLTQRASRDLVRASLDIAARLGRTWSPVKSPAQTHENHEPHLLILWWEPRPGWPRMMFDFTCR